MALKYKVSLLFAAVLVMMMSLAAMSVQWMVRMTIEADLEQQMDLVTEEIFGTIQREDIRFNRLDQKSAEAIVLQSIVGQFPVVMVSMNTSGAFQNWSGVIFYNPQYFYTMPDGSLPQNPVPMVRTISRQTHMTFPGGGEVVLLIEASAAEADSFAHRLGNVFFVVTILGLLLLLGMVFFLTEQVVSLPLQALGRLAHRISKGDLSIGTPLEMRKRGDEIGELATSFHTMMEALRSVRDEKEQLIQRTQDFNRELEQRVEDTRQDLSQKNLALIEARENLARQERMAALGHLAGNIAHEIGTPLSTLSGYLQLSLMDPSITPAIKEQLEVAAGEADRVTGIIRRVLGATRGLRPLPESVSLRSFLERLVELTLPGYLNSALKVHIDVPEGLPELVTDPELLRQVLTNLIKNAVDAMGDKGALTLRVQHDSAGLCIEVEDTGPGIPPELRQQIFEPFFTTKPPGKGTGLGLAICREIVQGLKGTLHVQDAHKGSGALFVLHLPDKLSSSPKVSNSSRPCPQGTANLNLELLT
ncbi:MAG: sensor histidine kinase [Myxococcota bacterium]